MPGEEIILLQITGGATIALAFIVFKAGWKTVWNEFCFQMWGRSGAIEIEVIRKNGMVDTVITKNAKEFNWGKDKEINLPIKSMLVNAQNTSGETNFETETDKKTKLTRPFNTSPRKIPKYFVIEGQEVNFNPYESPSVDQSNKRRNYAVVEAKQIGRLEATAEFLKGMKENKILFYAAVIACAASIIIIILLTQQTEMINQIAAKQGIKVAQGGLIPGLV